MYICNESKMRIFPIQVVEEVIRTTLNGKEKTYKVMLPDAEQTKFGIEKVKDTLFVSLGARWIFKKKVGSIDGSSSLIFSKIKHTKDNNTNINEQHAQNMENVFLLIMNHEDLP